MNASPSRAANSAQAVPGPAERVVVAMSGGVDSSLAAALLVAEGYETTLRLFDVMSMKVRNWSLTVDGMEKAEVPAGSFDAYKVTLAPLDGDVDTTTMYVSKDSPRCLLSRSGKLPATAGGGVASMTITKMEEID